MVKIKLFCKEENLELIASKIKDGSLEIVNTEADLYLFEAGYKKEVIIGKSGEEFIMIKPEEILYIECFGNDVICYHINNKTYFIKEKLYEIEIMLFESGLIRVNKSFIVNINFIKSIRAQLNLKFLLTMKNEAKIDVTRTYYYRFKSFVGL